MVARDHARSGGHMPASADANAHRPRKTTRRKAWVPLKKRLPGTWPRRARAPRPHRSVLPTSGRLCRSGRRRQEHAAEKAREFGHASLFPANHYGSCSRQRPAPSREAAPRAGPCEPRAMPSGRSSQRLREDDSAHVPPSATQLQSRAASRRRPATRSRTTGTVARREADWPTLSRRICSAASTSSTKTRKEPARVSIRRGTLATHVAKLGSSAVT